MKLARAGGGEQNPGRRRVTVLAVMSVVLCLAFDFSAVAKDLEELKALSLESLTLLPVETVTGASRHKQKVSDAPANVTILTRDEVKLYGWRTLGDALRSVSGMVITDDRSYGFLGVRGFNRPGDFSGRALITINGHRLNDAMFDSTAVDNDFLLDIDDIERIEVIRGPGSTLYGNNAFFGIVNVVTRRGRDLQGGEISGSYGTFDSYSGRLTYGNRFTNGVELMLSGTLEGSEGNPRLHYPEFSEINNGLAEHMDNTWSRHVFASVSWKDFSFEAGYVDRYKRVPTAEYTLPDAPLVFNDPRFEMFDERVFGKLKFTHVFDDDWQFMARLYYDHYRYDGFYPYHYNPADPFDPVTINYDLNQSESLGAEVQLTRPFFDKHLLTFGAEARYDFLLTIENRDLEPLATYLDAHRDGYFAGVYLQDEFQLRPNLTLTAGGRYDHFKVGGDTINPRAAIVYHPWNPSTIKLLYGQAYRAPNAYENYYAWPTPPEDLDLEPETVRSYELIYEHQFNQVLRGSAAVFRNELHNLISDGVDGFENLESATAQGIETELHAKWKNGLQGRLSYTYSDARDDGSDDRLPNSPEHLGKINLSIPLWRQQIFLSTEIQLMSPRETLAGETLNGFWIANATLFSRELLPGLEASVSVYNLFDQHYSDPASRDFLQSSIPQNGRTLRLKLTWHF